ncbi:MAG: hypothetical protein ACLFM0_08520 [Spirochaetales bacterium]
MGRRIFTLTVTVLVCFFAVAMTATAQDRVMTIEELYLEEDPGIKVLRAQALSSQRIHKELAIETLTQLVENESIGEDDSAHMAILRVLATDGSSYQVRTGGRVIYNNPDIRRDAVDLLSEIGGETARNVLREVLRFEREPMVLSQAVHGVGEVGLDGRGDIARDIARVMIRENARENPDLNLVYTALSTIEQIAEESTEGLEDDSLIENLIQISSGRYNGIVREQAKSTLNTLAGL